MKTIIHGESDDLIEIIGDWQEEFNIPYSINKTKTTINCSDGTKAKIEYDGNWHITIIEKGSLFEKIVLGNPAEDPHEDIDCIYEVPGYSDAIVFKESLEWVLLKGKKIKRK